jgi:hypothetical protein
MTNAAAHQMALEARDALARRGSPAADLLTVRLGEHLANPAREVEVMAVGGCVILGEIECRRFTPDLWELRHPGRFGCVMVGRTDQRDESREGDWKAVQYGEEPPLLLTETRQLRAALWIALDAYTEAG